MTLLRRAGAHARSSGVRAEADVQRTSSDLQPLTLCRHQDRGRRREGAQQGGERKLDVSRAAAEKLGFRQQGVAALVISVLQSPTQAEANYVSRRVYPMVPGYLGRFATVDIALETARARFRFDEEGEQPAEVVPPEASALQNGVPRPQLAVSPSLARELVMLRSPPRPTSPSPRFVEGPRLVSREVRLVQGPRLVSRASFGGERSLADGKQVTGN